MEELMIEAGDVFMDGGLEYVEYETSPEAPPQPPQPPKVATEPPPSPVASEANSSMERDIVSQILHKPSEQGTCEASPVQIDFIKSEEQEPIDLTLPESRDEVVPRVSPVPAPGSTKMEDEDAEDGSVEGDDSLELARQFLLQ
jgi:hypothetical protein